MELALSKRSHEIFNLCGIGVISISEVMAAAGCSILCEPDSPAVRYEVSTEKLSEIMELPETRRTVLEFVLQSGRSNL